MQIVSNGYNLHEKSKPVFWEKRKKLSVCIVLSRYCKLCYENTKKKKKKKHTKKQHQKQNTGLS